MYKKYFFITLAISLIINISAGVRTVSAQNSDIISGLTHLSSQQLFDTANHYYHKNSFDTALTYYSLFISTTPQNANFELQKKVVEAYNHSALIYRRHMHDYRTAYELLIKALILCEKSGYESFISKIYTNIGNIYNRFGKNDIAKFYFLKALELCQDSILMVAIMTNLGPVMLDQDSAFYFLNTALKISKQHDRIYSCNILYNLAVLHKQRENFDSAHYYYQLSLIDAREQGDIEMETQTLLNLGKLFLETNRADSMMFYVNLSNTTAKKHNLLEILAEIYLILSKIDDSNGRIASAYDHFRKYTELKDSIFGSRQIAEINQLQRLYETTKTNQQIEQFTIEQQIKGRIIRYQRINLHIILAVLLFVSTVLVFVFFQNRKLNTAYKVLFEKNVKIIDLQKKSPDQDSKKYQKSALTEDMQEALSNKILDIMEDTSVVCDAEFSVDKLAELVQSNNTYVSQSINTILKKNFRSLLNEYRIREAQRLFSESDMTIYTIEAIAFKVGFVSRNTFYKAFKENTGVSPNFYLKSVQNSKM